MNHIEEKIIQTIDEHRDEIIAFAKDIQSHPEPGFYEERTVDLEIDIFWRYFATPSFSLEPIIPTLLQLVMN